METTRVVMEIAAVGAVELVQSVDGVLRCMTVHDVEQYHQTVRMRSVNEFAQLFRCAITTDKPEQNTNA